jgi:iron complex outermembrane recepter protein
MIRFICNGPAQLAARRLALPTLAATILLSHSYAAQAQSESDGAATRSAGVEEVVVTATRRETDLHDVPFSISALSSKDIVRDRIVNMEDVTIHVPGILIINNGTNDNYLAIRGAALYDDSTGTDQGTSLYVDEVVRTGPADMNPDFYDVDRIEVLKGPQGTLFGRNATGGVVSVHTKDPVFKTEGQAEASYGNYNLREIKGVLNAPIVDGVLAGRVAVTTRWRDGWIKDTFLHRDLQSENMQTVRGKLLFTPTDDLRGLLTADYHQARGSRGNMVYGNFVPSLEPVAQNRATNTQGYPGRDDLKTWGITGQIDWTTSLGTLTSISAYRNVRNDQTDSATADPFGAITQVKGNDDKQFTQELRLASNLSGKFNWLTGLYYLDSKKSRPIDFLFHIIPGSFFDSIGISGERTSQVRQDTHTKSVGVFGEGTYNLTETLKITVGARYTHDAKDGFSLINPSNTLSGTLISANYDDSWTAFTPKFTLTYQPSDALLTYATVSKGFQGGGFNTQGETSEALNTPFKPAIVWNYEAGVKFTGADRRLQANVSAFLNRYSQMQLVSYIPNAASSVTTNAGKAEIRGVEADLAAVPVDWLTLGLQYAWLDSKFTSYVVDNGPDAPPSDYTGNKVPYIPTHSITARAELNFNAPSLRGRIAIGGDYTYRSSLNMNPEDSLAQFIIDKTVWNGMVNMHASWTSDDERLAVELWGKNLGNIWYTPMTNDLAIFYQTPAERAANPDAHMYIFRPNTPRTFGITMRIKF